MRGSWIPPRDEGKFDGGIGAPEGGAEELHGERQR